MLVLKKFLRHLIIFRVLRKVHLLRNYAIKLSKHLFKFFTLQGIPYKFNKLLKKKNIYFLKKFFFYKGKNKIISNTFRKIKVGYFYFKFPRLLSLSTYMYNLG